MRLLKRTIVLLAGAALVTTTMSGCYISRHHHHGGGGHGHYHHCSYDSYSCDVDGGAVAAGVAGFIAGVLVGGCH